MISRIASSELPVRLEPAHGEVEALLALVDLRDRLAADRRLDDRVDVAGVEPVARARARGRA